MSQEAEMGKKVVLLGAVLDVAQALATLVRKAQALDLSMAQARSMAEVLGSVKAMGFELGQALAAERARVEALTAPEQMTVHRAIAAASESARPLLARAKVRQAGGAVSDFSRE